MCAVISALKNHINRVSKIVWNKQPYTCVSIFISVYLKVVGHAGRNSRVNQALSEINVFNRGRSLAAKDRTWRMTKLASSVTRVKWGNGRAICTVCVWKVLIGLFYKFEHSLIWNFSEKLSTYRSIDEHLSTLNQACRKSDKHSTVIISDTERELCHTPLGSTSKTY